MNEKYIETLIEEIRNEFQIPPYFSNSALSNYVLEGDAQFKALNNSIDYEHDVAFRMLIKTYVFYAYHKKTDEFFENYRSNITAWQFSNLEEVGE